MEEVKRKVQVEENDNMLLCDMKHHDVPTYSTSLDLKVLSIVALTYIQHSLPSEPKLM